MSTLLQVFEDRQWQWIRGFEYEKIGGKSRVCPEQTRLCGSADSSLLLPNSVSMHAVFYNKEIKADDSCSLFHFPHSFISLWMCFFKEKKIFLWSTMFIFLVNFFSMWVSFCLNHTLFFFLSYISLIVSHFLTHVEMLCCGSVLKSCHLHWGWYLLF